MRVYSSWVRSSRLLRPQTGLSYSDLSRIVMERATSAREAVEIVGALIEEHGYATYGGNSHMFADPNEGWVLINYAGGQGLWAAERLGPDDVRVSYPGYIGDFPVDFRDNPDFKGSANLVQFAIQQGWWKPDSGEPFNLHQVYGRPFPSAPGQDDPHNLYRYPPLLEEEIEGLAPVGVAQMMALVRDPRWSNDGSGYGQVAHLRQSVRPELGVLWMSITGAVASPFVPIHVGVEEIPAEYKQHRYMTKDADRAFLDSEFAPLEATCSAFRIHKRLLYHTCEQPRQFLAPVTGALEVFEALLLEEQPTVEAQAAALYENGMADSAGALLTGHAMRRLTGALRLGGSLVERVETDSRERFPIRMPEVDVPEGASWRAESEPMTRRPGRAYHRCFVPGLDEYPRSHGSYASRGWESLANAAFAEDQSARTGSSQNAIPLLVLGLATLLLGFVGGLLLGRRRWNADSPRP
jgi:LPXTG-motif cell wall-anchored protein